MAAKKTILVVEDDADQSAYLTTLFGDAGYVAVSARDGNQAMARAKESKPDLITLDMSMPEKSGVKFYTEIRSDPELAGVPVLVITGVTGMGGKPEDFEKFLAGRKQIPPPQGFMPKPVDRDRLLAKVKELLE